MAEEPSDAELVQRFRDGDPHGFEVLLHRHEQRIYNLAYRMLSDADEARDATQDAFLSAYRRLDAFRGDAAFGTWLYRIGINTCYDALRKRARTPQPAEIPEREAPGSDHGDRTGTAIDVQRALAEIPEEFRSVLILHDVQDLPYDQIATILDVPLGTVKSRLHRGRAMLGRRLAGTSDAFASSEGVEP